MNQFVMWIQIVVVLLIIVNIFLVRRHQLCNKSFGTCCLQIKECTFWIFLKDCTRKLEKKNKGLL